MKQLSLPFKKKKLEIGCLARVIDKRGGFKIGDVCWGNTEPWAVGDIVKIIRHYPQNNVVWSAHRVGRPLFGRFREDELERI